MEPSKQIFISYSRENITQAEALIRVLQSNMWSVWWDQEGIEVGDLFGEAIEDALKEAVCVISLWSKASVKSTWVRSEANRALEDDKLLPVVLDDAKIPMPFEGLHTADLRTWDGVERNHRGLQNLLSSISKRVQPKLDTLKINTRESLEQPDREQTVTALYEKGDSWTNSFDEAYVISDLHLGGAPGLQAMNQVERLSKLIELLTHVRTDDRVALIINGDLIDFASEDFEGLVAERDAATIIERTFSTPVLRRVWESLAVFAQSPNRYLILILGDGDMELALPNASQVILHKLTGDKISARGKTTLVGFSSSFKCRVGHAKVLCKHGHDVDRYNAVDYGLLSLFGTQQTDGVKILNADRAANAGRLISRKFLNLVRLQFPFVDMLKPETTAVHILLALQPRILTKILWMSPQILRRLSNSPARINTNVHLVQTDRVADELNPFASLALFLWKGNKVERLRKLLIAFNKVDTTFTLTTRDEIFASIVGNVNTEFDFLVAGHSHLERAINCDPGRFYYNTGTWTRLARFSNEMLSNAESFGTIFEALVGSDIDVLDGLNVPLEDGGKIPFVLNRPTVLRISSNSNGVVGQLCHVFDSSQKTVRLEPVAGTTFWKK